MKKRFYIIIAFLIFSIITPLTISSSYGHGVGSETFPPVELDGKRVTIEVSSSTNNPDESDNQQISISMIDFDSKITLEMLLF